ncbi:hypothetical protein UFOVP807_38 [uncultured Caudovirales phage]|uniref:Uncharacterized protein n=1 Tax=uncultured Caudovirales phage TaxID=2100421 RepID=A0A6J5P156_9CAUD|nr:hypothetical protein UFOVP339_3 [uncultured Caudovirales phage]CAB4163706.1 hypothetical protein UFOVP807_38 [uncultured Caudovirales phage]
MTDKNNLSGWSVDRVKVNKSFSEETVCFRAEVHLDGKHVGFAFNDGHGGSTGLSHKAGHESVAFPAGLCDHIDLLVEDAGQKQEILRCYKRWVKEIMTKGRVFVLRAAEAKAWEAGEDHTESLLPPFRVYSSAAQAAKLSPGHEHIVYDEHNLNALYQRMIDSHSAWKKNEAKRWADWEAKEKAKLDAKRVYNEPPASPQMPDGY